MRSAAVCVWATKQAELAGLLNTYVPVSELGTTMGLSGDWFVVREGVTNVGELSDKIDWGGLPGTA